VRLNLLPRESYPRLYSIYEVTVVAEHLLCRVTRDFADADGTELPKEFYGSCSS
jgi:hypothetical protein